MFLNRRILTFLLLVALLPGCSLFKPPRCPVAGCHVKMVHLHKGVSYRGRPWYKFNKNPKMGQEFRTEQAHGGK